ncbi:MAG: hypothetical protein NTZ52_04155 [Chlamydiae bacterium]|nr:hypothetical protein [Chlamydiota bacterium]
MNNTSWIVCNAFLSKAGASIKNKLVRYLPQGEQDLINKIAPSENNPLTANYDQSALLNLVHYTWLTAFLRTLSEVDVGLFLSSLPEPVAKPIKNTVLYSKELSKLTLCAQEYLRSILIDTLLKDQPDIIPMPVLPHSAMNTLLDLPHSTLQKLIEYLGLHDLSVEMKQIIDMVKIKKIQTTLPEDKIIYLKGLSQKAEPVLFKRMELSKWDGTPDTLFKVLYHRGLNRLAKALHPEHASLVWYISRMIPWQESTTFQNLCKPLEHPKAAPLLAHQILEILPLLQKNSPKDLL